MKQTTYKNIKLNEKLDPDTFYKLAETGHYDIGDPKIVGSGFMRHLEFPPINRYKIMASISGTTVTVNSTYNGAGGLLKDVGLDAITNGWSKILGTKEDNVVSDAINDIAEVLIELLGDKVK